MPRFHQLSLEESLYEQRRIFHRTQKWLRCVKYILLIVNILQIVYSIYVMTNCFNRLNQFEFWTRPSNTVHVAIQSESFDLFVMFTVVLFNLVGLVGTHFESFTLTAIHCFGTSMALILSLFADRQQHWPSGHQLTLQLAISAQLMLAISFFLLMHKRRVSN